MICSYFSSTVEIYIIYINCILYCIIVCIKNTDLVAVDHEGKGEGDDDGNHLVVDKIEMVVDVVKWR